MMLDQRLAISVFLFIVVLVFQGHGAIIRFNEPAVRVVIDDPVSSLDEDVMATITITDDDGVTPLANGAEVSFNVNLEYDAFLPSFRVDEPTSPFSITADGIRTDFPVILFKIEGVNAFFLLSFKLIATLQSDEDGEVPTTVMESSTVEFRIYNSIAFHPQFLVLNPAVLKRKGDEDLYLYGIGSRTYENRKGEDIDDEITLWKDGSVVAGSRRLLLRRSFDTAVTDQGKYWKIKRFSKRNDKRFGVYEMTSMFQATFLLENVTAFVNPLSEHLNSNGIKTITVYRKTSDPTLLEAPLNFGVRRTPLSGSIRWFKDRRRVNTGPRYTIRKAEDAGLYTLHRYTRRKRCWYAHILVHVARCDRNEVSLLGTCLPSEQIPCHCLNGGVCNDVLSFICQCPPCFRGIYCEHRALTDSSFAIGESRDFECGDLPGGNKRCKGYKFCLGGNYGCSCGCGWEGPECNKPCRYGLYGANCSQRCNCLGSSCDRFTGACESSRCPTGFKGFNCQVPAALPFGDSFIPGI